MSEPLDAQQLLTALTTEHFTLQGARSQTISESSSRATLYLGSVSSVLVAIGFLGQRGIDSAVFRVFALTVLPTLYALGWFTFARLVQTGIEDFVYGRAINRIRHRYRELAGEDADLFLLGGHDDTAGVMANMGVVGGWLQLLFTIATMIAVVTGVVGGSAVALAAGVALGASLGVCVGVGAVFAVASVAVMVRVDARLNLELERRTTSLFPSP